MFGRLCNAVRLTTQIARRQQNPNLINQRFYSNKCNQESTAQPRKSMLPLIGATVGCATLGTIIYYKDEIFGDDDLTGAEIRYLKSIGFEKEYFYDGLYNWRNYEPIRLYGNRINDLNKKLSSTEQTYDLCLEAVRFNPKAITIIKPEFITVELLKEMSNTSYLVFGDSSFIEFSGYDLQYVTKMTFDVFEHYYDLHCERFNVDESTKTKILAEAKNIFRAWGQSDHRDVDFEVYMAKNKTLKAIGIDYP